MYIIFKILMDFSHINRTRIKRSKQIRHNQVLKMHWNCATLENA